MMQATVRTVVALVTGVAFAIVSPDASAQDRRFTARLSLGAAPPALTGLLHDGPTGLGFAGSFALELRPIDALGIELEGAYVLFPVTVPESSGLQPFASDASAQLGLRLHPVAGLYLGASGGVHTFLRELRFGGSAEIGWDLAVTPGFSMGIFGRGTFIAAAEDRPNEAWLVFGLTFALGNPIAAAVNTSESSASPETRGEPVAPLETVTDGFETSASPRTLERDDTTPADEDFRNAPAASAPSRTSTHRRHPGHHRARPRPRHRRR